MQADSKLNTPYMHGNFISRISIASKYVSCLFSGFIFALAFIIFIFSSPPPARADACSDLRSQLRATGRTGNTKASPEVAQLTRQLAAIRALERQRQCSASDDRGGFFNPCADLASRRDEVLRQMNRAAGPGRRSASFDGGVAIRAKLAALGCPAPQPRQAGQEGDRTMAGGPAMLFCVRLSDGYFFPAPNSQFVGENDYKTTLDRCRFICADSGMDVYSLRDVSLETEEMVSIETRKPYKDLTVAFAYRHAAAFRSCDLQRYYRRVDEARARSVTPGFRTRVNGLSGLRFG